MVDLSRPQRGQPYPTYDPQRPSLEICIEMSDLPSYAEAASEILHTQTQVGGTLDASPVPIAKPKSRMRRIGSCVRDTSPYVAGILLLGTIFVGLPVLLLYIEKKMLG
ncbi:hypothetical protein BJY00DRAFT_306939 [Aspergillus carlsbadensis]|nr:hypothetical protein BJY00DRAFT_306939 [Aspergillus carlsbadensis]